MEKIEIKKNNWDQISLIDYCNIRDILEDNSLSKLEKNIMVLAILTDCDVEDIRNLSIASISNLFSQIDFLSKFTFEKWTKFKDKTIKIKDREFVIPCDLTSLSYGQYVDFNQFQKNKDNTSRSFAQIASVFLIPKGKKYGEEDIVDFLEENLPISTYNSINFFILNNLDILTRAMRIYLKVMLRKKRIPREQSEQIEKNLQTLLSFGYNSLI